MHVPDWLKEYDEKAERSPCLFGLPQLQTEPTDKPLAIVEAPKTAIICTAFAPAYIWLSVGALSYLKAERLNVIRHRKIMLYPDLNAYHDRISEQGNVTKGWLSRANEFRAQGFTIEVSDYLERSATPQQREQGLDLADFLLSNSKKFENGVSKSVTHIRFPNAPLSFDVIKQFDYLQRYISE